ncbi:MAG: caspase family protein, partial [Elusimicrobiota bacterium]
HGADPHAARPGTIPGAAKAQGDSALLSSPHRAKAQADEALSLVSIPGAKPAAATRIPAGTAPARLPAEESSDEAPEAAPRPSSHASDVDRPTYKLGPRPADYALIVGVEKYSKLPAASFAERDAAAVRKHLEAMGFPPRNIIHLKGQAATRGALQGYIEEWLPRNIKPESTLFFYYSGHGAPDPKTGEAFLVPWDGDAMFLQSTAYPLKQLYSSLAKLKAKEIVIALDSCFSGAGGRSVLAAGARPLVTKVDEGVVPRGNITLFAAASGDEITGSLDEQGHGMFTYYFLKGLGGAAKDSSGAVTAKSLYEYLRPNVQDEANRQNREQTPRLVGQQDRTIIQF